MEKKKIGIVSTQNQLNYGGVLQAFALKSKLNELCPKSNVELVNLWCFVDNNDLFGEHYSYFRRFWSKAVIKRLLIRMDFCPMAKHRKRRENTLRFLDTYANNSKTVYKTPQELWSKECEYDAVVVGSDQVWRYQSLMHHYALLSGIKNPNVKKISYAASLGWSELPEEYHDEFIPALMDFNAISVREPTGVTALTKLLDGKKEINWCVDPTLLVGREFWNNFVKATSCVVPKEDYAFVYWLADLEHLEEIFLGLKQQGFKKIIYVSPWYMKMLNGKISKVERFRKHAKKVYNAEWCIDGGPLEFVHLLANSKYVVANSFHAMMFSLIFSKKLRIYVDVNKTGDKMAPRMKDFASRYGIENVVYEGVKGNCNFDMSLALNFDSVWDKINVDRAIAETFLVKSLQD